MSQPIAIRSLQCVDHAMNIPPMVLSCTWLLGKRCNYDCSYCPAHWHDAVSPFVDSEIAKRFIRGVDQWCKTQNKKIQYNFMGGEPFLDPSFLDILDTLRNLESTGSIRAVSNGSMPFENYHRASSLLEELTVSLHFDRSDSEIKNTIDKFADITTCNLHWNVMYLQGHLARIQAAVDILRSRNQRFVLRKIFAMPDSRYHSPFVSSAGNRKEKILLPLREQHRARYDYVLLTDRYLDNDIANHYSNEEIIYYNEVNQHMPWRNCGVWFDDGSYREMNTDELVMADQTNFKNWTCFAGVDGIHIDFDGSIYRGVCLTGDAIGHISNSIGFVDQAVVCTKRLCACNVDIATRKSMEPDFRMFEGSDQNTKSDLNN